MLRDKDMEGTCLLSMWCPVYRGRDSKLGFRTELENLDDDAKGKDTSAETRGRKYQCAIQGRTPP
jgi:hypothetical protein